MKGLLAALLFSALLVALFFSIEGSGADVGVLLALIFLEIGLSFDNAVINAHTLKGMSLAWRRRFLYFGLPIAVFGMRLLLPLLLVACTSQFSLSETFSMAFHNSSAYQQVLSAGYPLIAGFGGAFLIMVFLNFLLDHERQIHWFRALEQHRYIQKIAHLPFSALGLTLVLGFLISLCLHSFKFSAAFVLGAFLNMGLHHLQQKFRHSKLLSQGLVGFIYLECLDASFSLDGVLGAFAMTSHIWLIMLGLGIGALFVRSFTLLLLEREALKKWVYLEHGAHYAILFLAFVMLVNIFWPVPEALTAVMSLFILALTFLRKKDLG